MQIKATHFLMAGLGILALSGQISPIVHAQNDAMPEGPGKSQVVAQCSSCHATDLIVAQKRSTAEWKDIMERMEGFGATISSSNKVAILGYLTAHFNTETPAADGGALAPAAGGK
ncbi:MAG: hypothetical protein QM605_11720 [Sphingobium sp.]